MGKEVGGFLAKKFCQLGESILGPNQETMAATEQIFLDLVRRNVEKAGVQSGGTHQIIIQKNNPLIDTISTDTINILVGEGGELKVGQIVRAGIDQWTETIRIFGPLTGKKRLAVISKQIEVLTKFQ